MEFYILKDLNRIGKIENYIPYLYDSEKGWVPDQENLLMDRLMGYDGESVGSSSLVFDIEEIDKEQAEEFIKTYKG